MGDFYRVPADKRNLNYDNYLSQGTDRNGLTEFNSNNTRLLTIDETADKLLTLKEIQNEVKKWENK